MSSPRRCTSPSPMDSGSRCPRRRHPLTPSCGRQPTSN
jgi:hypothetical protein